MAKLTAKARKAVPKSEFGLPGEKKYPMPDKSHAANAKARATQQEKAGNLSPGAKAKIDSKANKVLKSKKTNTRSMTPSKVKQTAARITSRLSAKSKRKTEVGFD